MASAASKGGVVALQRRRSKTAQQGRSLGAVRLKDTTDAASVEKRDKRVLQDIENNGVPAVKPSPLEVVDGGGEAQRCNVTGDEATPDALSPTTRFQTELASNGTTDKWFDEQLTEGKHTHRATSGSSASASSRSQLTERFQRIQDTFKQHFRAAVLSASSGGTETIDVNALQRLTDAPRRSTPGIMDLGLDAINKVGQTCLDIAEAVDTTIEQWLEGFQNLDEVARMLESSTNAGEDVGSQEVEDDADSGSRINIREQQQPQRGKSGTGTAPLSSVAALDAHSIDAVSSPAGGHRNGRRNPPPATPVSKSARKAQEELVAQMSQDVAAREAEFKRMQGECMRLQAELRYAANKCSALSEENSLLRNGGSEVVGGMRMSEPEPDPITDLMASQLEALLAEKAKLAQDNARLLRENTTLQDMLSIGLGSDEEDDDEEDRYYYQ